MKGRKIQSAYEGWAELKRIIFPPWWRYYFSIRSQLRSADLGSMRRSSAVIMFHDRTEGPDKQNLKKKKKACAREAPEVVPTLRGLFPAKAVDSRCAFRAGHFSNAANHQQQIWSRHSSPTSTNVVSAYLLLHFKFRLLLFFFGYNDQKMPKPARIHEVKSQQRTLGWS